MAEDKPEIMMVNDREEDGRSDAGKGLSSVRTIDNIRVIGMTADDASFYEGFSDKDRKQMVRKVRSSDYTTLFILHDHRSPCVRSMFDSYQCYPSYT